MKSDEVKTDHEVTDHGRLWVGSEDVRYHAIRYTIALIEAAPENAHRSYWSRPRDVLNAIEWGNVADDVRYLAASADRWLLEVQNGIPKCEEDLEHYVLNAVCELW